MFVTLATDLLVGVGAGLVWRTALHVEKGARPGVKTGVIDFGNALAEAR